MESVIFLLTSLLGQTAETAAITISFSDALVGGGVVGGIPVATWLGWLGVKRVKAKNGNGRGHGKDRQIELLTEIAGELKTDREVRQHQYEAQHELQKQQLDVLISLDKSDSKVEDRLVLVREELKEVRDALHDELKEVREAVRDATHT